MWFDVTTGLLAKSETRVKDEFQGWKEVTDETFLSDYAEVNGAMAFLKMRVVRDGKPLLESKMSEQKRHESLDPKLFAEP
jgi:hypothetical protein